MTTAVSEPRARRAEARPRVPAYVTASQRRVDRRSRRIAMLGEGPWRRRDRSIVVGGCVLALIGLGICSWGGSGEVELSAQIDWLLAGIGCVSLSSVCLAYWLLSGLRTVRIEVAQVFGTITPNRPVAAGAVAGSGFVTVAGMVRYHRRECPLVEGKSTRAVDPAEGLRPCGACDSGDGVA
jgi:hypothetical protein